MEMKEEYRFITGTLYAYSKNHLAYVAVFTDYRCRTIQAAIKAYENV